LIYNKTILVIEQDATVRHCLKEVIEMEGYRVLVAENQAVAKILLETAEKPWLLIMDHLTSPDHFQDFDPAQMTTLERPINVEHLLNQVSLVHN
jgi:CheY-like chemotaxis protein